MYKKFDYMFEEMNKEQKIQILKKYKQADGTVVLPMGLTFNNWSNINASYVRGNTIMDTVADIEEEIEKEKEYAQK